MEVQGASQQTLGSGSVCVEHRAAGDSGSCVAWNLRLSVLNLVELGRSSLGAKESVQSIHGESEDGYICLCKREGSGRKRLTTCLPRFSL